MRRSGAAVIRTNEDKLRYLVGSRDIEVVPREIFSDVICDFLNDLARVLRTCVEAQAFPDVQTFAFWIRKANYLRLKEQCTTIKQERIGRGLVFHIAPSNVPINFAYTLVFGMMSGNVNIVRTSSKAFPQVDIICKSINRLVSDKYNWLARQICGLKYEASKEITDYFSRICHARVIWGGDNTIQEIRKSLIMPRAVELNFADRFSFAIVNPEVILQLDCIALNKLAVAFYNDTYLMDQNACTVPHILFWKKSAGVS